MVFVATNDRVFFAPGLEGGVFQDSGRRCDKVLFPYLSHSVVVIPYSSTPAVPSEEKKGDDSMTPLKSGGSCGPA